MILEKGVQNGGGKGKGGRRQEAGGRWEGNEAGGRGMAMKQEGGGRRQEAGVCSGRRYLIKEVQEVIVSSSFMR